MNRKLTYLSFLLLMIITFAFMVIYSYLTKTNDQSWDVSSRTVSSVQTADKIKAVLDKMTLEEKIGQMFLVGIYTSDSTKILQDLIKQREIGSVILLNPNISNQKVSTVTASLQKTATSSGQPLLLIAIDQEGGIVSRIKDKGWELTSQAQIKNEEQAYEVALTRGQELYTSGINVNFAPVLDYIANPSSFLYPRVFRGKKTEFTKFGIAMVNGYQDAGISATVKHFPGHDNNSVDSHKNLPVSLVTEENMSEYIQIFRDVINGAKPSIVMTGHVLFPKIDPMYPATLSLKIIGLLRTGIGFDGVIITDDMNMGAITVQFSVEDAAKQAIIAGNDILLYVATKDVVDRAYTTIVNAVKDGQISENRIDSSVYRILTLKDRLLNSSNLH